MLANKFVGKLFGKLAGIFARKLAEKLVGMLAETSTFAFRHDPKIREKLSIFKPNFLNFSCNKADCRKSHAPSNQRRT